MLASRVRRGVKRRLLFALRAWAGEPTPEAGIHPPVPKAASASVPETAPSTAAPNGASEDWRAEFESALREIEEEEASDAAAPPAELAPDAESAPASEPEHAWTGPRKLTREALEQVLDEMVRPALQADGGDIELVRIENNDVYVNLVGACTSCPSSIMTMRMGVERLLQDEFEDMGELIQANEPAEFY